MPAHPPLVLIVRDGWGENPHPEHGRFNAVELAETPAADRLMREYPSTLIRTCGEDVGLPAGVMGNSEVGHQNIGAGRIVDQELMRITRAIRDGSFATNPALNAAIDHALATGGRVHLLGLVSDGQVHSDLGHLFAIVDLAAARGLGADRLLVHVITDGRDTSPRGGLQYAALLEDKLRDAGVGRIGSVMGRYWAMDRDHRWDRVALAYDCLTGRGGAGASSAAEIIRGYYDHPSEPSRAGDEFILPARVGDSAVASGDTIIFFNFRGDRPRELTRAFMLEDDAWSAVAGGGFDRGAKLDGLFYCTLTRYEQGLPVTAVAFEKPPKMQDILGDVIAKAGLTQFRCAETEKYPHVTFFFNDYREEPFDGEHRLLVPSPRDVSTYDQKPQMSAPEVCDGVVARLGAADCERLLVVNFANPDMVGHTGDLDATIRAVQTVDACVGRIVDAALGRGGSLIVTADHGNAEQMWDPANDCPHTAHTVYDVPLIVVGEPFRAATLRDGGRLADVAPTALHMLGLEPPAAMTGRTLL